MIQTPKDNKKSIDEGQPPEIGGQPVVDGERPPEEIRVGESPPAESVAAPEKPASESEKAKAEQGTCLAARFAESRREPRRTDLSPSQPTREPASVNPVTNPFVVDKVGEEDIAKAIAGDPVELESIVALP